MMVVGGWGTHRVFSKSVELVTYKIKYRHATMWPSECTNKVFIESRTPSVTHCWCESACKPTILYFTVVRIVNLSHSGEPVGETADKSNPHPSLFPCLFLLDRKHIPPNSTSLHSIVMPITFMRKS